MHLSDQVDKRNKVKSKKLKAAIEIIGYDQNLKEKFNSMQSWAIHWKAFVL